jgi:hypothetical protein
MTKSEKVIIININKTDLNYEKKKRLSTMAQYFFACDHRPYLFDTESGRVFQLQQAEFIDVTHTALPSRLRFNAEEIGRREALRMAGLNGVEIEPLTGLVDNCLEAFAGEGGHPLGRTGCAAAAT